MIYIEIVLAILAVYAITLIAGRYDGLFDVLEKARSKMPDWLREGVECFVCMAVWVAIPFALYFDMPFVLVWFGIAGGAILLEEITS